MSEEIPSKVANSNLNKLDLIILILQRLQEDLHMTKCQLRTSIREVMSKQSHVADSFYELNRSFRDIDERLHGIELKQNQQN
jgi:hypothetical protein